MGGADGPRSTGRLVEHARCEQVGGPGGEPGSTGRSRATSTRSWRSPSSSPSRSSTGVASSGYDPWQDGTFRLLVADPRRRADPPPLLAGLRRRAQRRHYGIYNFNWAYYLESLRMLCADGAGKPFQPPDWATPLTPTQ